MSLSIVSISMIGFEGATETGASGIPVLYGGHPLYCHVYPSGASEFTIVVNTIGPSTFAPGKGAVTAVIVDYAPRVADPHPKPLQYFPSAACKYDGREIDLSVLMTTPQTGTIQLTQAPDPANVKADTPAITTMTLSSTITGAEPIMFFVKIPFPVPAAKATTYKTATITWPDQSGGGSLGPMGGGEVP